MFTNSSTRRNASRAAGRAGILAAVMALVPLTPLSVAPATAGPVEKQQAYDCTVIVEENPSEPAQMDLNVKINLNLPDQVTAGEELSVDGSFSTQLPGEMGALMGAYFPFGQVTSDGINLPVTIGGEEQLVSTSYIDTGRIDMRRPPVVFEGSFTTDPVQVPQGAEGEVGFSMPRNDTVPAISRDGMAAFTATLIAEGGIVPGYDKGTDRVSCNAKGTPAQIGTVPIVAGESAPGPDVNGAGGAGGAGSAGSGSGAANDPAPQTNRVADAQNADGDSDGDSDGDRDGDSEASDNEAAASGASAEQAAAMREMADQMRLASMNQAATREDGAYVPLSVIGWGTLGIVLASVLFTVAMNTRTRRLERSAQDFGE